MTDKEFLAYLLKSEQCIGQIMSSGFKSAYIDFENMDFSPLRSLFETVCSFYLRYKKLIDREHLPTYLQQGQLTAIQINQVLFAFEDLRVLTPAREFNFLADLIKKSYAKTLLHRNINFGVDSLINNDMAGAIRHIKAGVFSAENIFNSEAQEGTIQDSVDLRTSDYEERKGGKKLGLPSGFPTFDRACGGMHPGELIIILSGTKEGKSTFLLNVGHHLQAVCGKNVFFVSVENPKAQLERRYDSLHSGLSCSKLRDGTLTPDEEEIYKQALLDIKSRAGSFFVWDQPSCSPQSINAKLLELESTTKFDIIIIDYLSLLRPDNPTKENWINLGQLSKSLREMGRSRGIPVLTACQVGREAIKKKGQSYGNTDVSFSFEIVQNSDTVLSLRVNNPDVLNSGQGICEINAYLTKCRDGNQKDFVIEASFERMKLTERTFGAPPSC